MLMTEYESMDDSSFETKQHTDKHKYHQRELPGNWDQGEFEL